MRPPEQRPPQPRWQAALAFVAGVALSLAAGAWQLRHNAEQAQSRFGSLADRSTAELLRRLQSYEYGLRGARGALIGAGVEQITRERFREYSASRELQREFPGARGFGMIRRVAPGDEARFVAMARADGMPEFALRQLQPHGGDRYVIQYIEPVETNRAAVGLDIASEANRKSAAERAMRSGQATLTGPITLVQASGAPLRSFLLLLPVYRPGPASGSPQAREAATFGWVYAPLLIDEVLAGFDFQGGEFALRLHDRSAGGETFFTSAGATAVSAGALVRRLPVELYGRVWEVELQALPPFVASLNQISPRAVVMAGAVLSALLAVLLHYYLLGVLRARQAAAERARRAAIVGCSQDAIIAADVHGVVTDWNAGAQRLFGYSAADAIGREVAELIVPGGHEPERARIVSGEELAPYDTVRRRRDGTLIDVSIATYPVRGEDGRITGYAKTVRDISDRKAAEAAVLRTNAELERLVAERTAQLQAASRDLHNILDAVPSVIGYWDREQRVRFANRAYCDWFGVDPARLLELTVRDVVGEGYEAIRPHVEAALRGEPQRFERDVPRLGGGAPRRAVTHYLPDVVEGEVRGFYGLLQDITEQTDDKARLAAALRENEALLSTLRLHGIFSAADRTGRIIDVNDGFCRISGYSREELVGQNHRIVNSGEQDRDFWSAMWGTIASGKPWRGVVCNRAKDGSLYWVDSLIAPCVGADGRIEKYVSIRFDMTAAKQAEALLQKTNERFRLASQAARLGVWEWDLASDTLVCDELMYALFRRTPVQGPERFTDWAGAVHPDDWPGVEAALQGALHPQGEFDAEFRIVWPDGEVHHLRAAAVVVRDDHGAALRMTGVSFDITAHKRAELELRDATSLLSKVLESASEVSIIAIGPDGRIAVFNRGAERLLGYASDEMIGQATPLAIHDAAEVRERAEELSAALGRPLEGMDVFIEETTLGQPREWTYVRKDGGRRTVSLAVTAMRGEDGVLRGYLGVAHDVSERKRQEASLRHAMHKAEQANRAKSQFLANMSHEIRTPMNAVVGLTYLLEQTRLDAEQQASLGKMKLAGKALLGVINDVLDLSKIEAGEFAVEQAPFDPARLLRDLREVMEVQAAAKRIELMVEVPDELPRRLVGDATRLNQVLTNLLSNAIKFTDRGSVRLKVHCVTDGDQGVALRFEVRDTGVGIASDVQSRLFTPFTQADASTTRRFGGTGLGLSIVKSIVELMGGTVGLDSQVGRGSRFWAQVNLPLPREALDSGAGVLDELPAIAGNLALQGVRVLIVDDSDINLEVARRILSRAGAVCSLAGNGEEALAALRASPASIDLVLMDVQMPVLDGVEATKRIRGELCLAVPVIALTAGALVSERQRALAAGMSDFVTKPFEPKALIETMRRHVVATLPVQASGLPSAVADRAAWPEIDGIDRGAVMERLDGDVALFAGMLERLLDEYLEAPPVQALPTAARMHKLRGAAGMLGAVALQRAAGEAEAALNAGTSSGKAERGVAVRLELQRLRSAAAPLIAEQRGRREAAAGRAGRLDAAAVRHLVELLQANDLRALDAFEQLEPALRRELGDAAILRLRRGIDGLQFRVVVELLAQSPIGEAQPRVG